MTNVALFGVGLLVTLIVAAAMALLIFGAIMDGREEEISRAERDQAAGRRPATDADLGDLGVVGA